MRFKCSEDAIDASCVYVIKSNTNEFEKTVSRIKPIRKPVNNMITRTFFRVKKRTTQANSLIKLWKRRKAIRELSAKVAN